MLVGWVNYAGVAYCVRCAERELLDTEIEASRPIWKGTYWAVAPCYSCKHLIDQCHKGTDCYERSNGYGPK